MKSNIYLSNIYVKTYFKSAKKIGIAFLLFYFTLTQLLPQASLSGIIINEILPNPNGSSFSFDTDGDGTTESQDEFVELYNTTGSAVDISGWSIQDEGAGSWLTFPVSTSIPANGYVIAVNRYDPGPLPSNYYERTSGSSAGIINNGGDAVYLVSSSGDYIIAIYNGYSADVLDASLTLTGVQQGSTEDFGSDVDGKSVQRHGDGNTAFITDTPTPHFSNSTLPVELVSFSAAVKPENVLLNWETSTEINNEYFVVERSKDGQLFQPIEQVLGAGNSSHPISYQTIDKDPLSGTSYYRLKQIDFDGEYTYSNQVAVNFMPANLQIRSISNTDGLLKISFYTGSEIPVNFAIYDILGSLKAEKNIVGEKGHAVVEISTSVWNPGIYVLRLNQGRNVLTERFLIE